METYLKKIGFQVHKVTELQSGDIVGEAKPHDIRLYYVERVDPNPHYLKWFGPRSPYVSFKVPHVGLDVINGKEYRTYLYTHPPTESYKFKWSEMPLEEALNHKEYEEWKEFGIDPKHECFDLYKITDPEYVKLGKLIPDIEVPYWSALPQTTKGHQPIFDFVERTKDYFSQARELHEKIKIEVRRMQ